VNNREVLWPLRVPQNVSLRILQEVLFISNFNVLPGQRCTRSQAVCSIVGNALEHT
jgi:hypothetical protein